MTVTEPTTEAETRESSMDDDVVTPADAADTMVVDDLLVEEISIDGMCGVY